VSLRRYCCVENGIVPKRINAKNISRCFPVVDRHKIVEVFSAHAKHCCVKIFCESWKERFEGNVLNYDMHPKRIGYANDNDDAGNYIRVYPLPTSGLRFTFLPCFLSGKIGYQNINT
jgi:hypothetical protein